MVLDRKATEALRRSSELLVKSIGLKESSELTGRSTTQLSRYYKPEPGRNSSFMPIDVIATLERKADFPYVTKCLADFKRIVFTYEPDGHKDDGHLNKDVINLSERFAVLMMEYHKAMDDGEISINEAKDLLRETTALQKVLIEMKLHLDSGASSE